jgi:hypothetical protein
LLYYIILYINIFNRLALLLYQAILRQALNSLYIERRETIKTELKVNKGEKGSFSLTLDAWTAINQDAYLGITM